MITTLIKKLMSEQKTWYVDRYDILGLSLSEEERISVSKRGNLSNSDLAKVRIKVLWLEGEYNNSSFEEGMLRSLEMLRKTVHNDIWKYITKLKQEDQVSKDFILWMTEIYRLIK